MKNSTSRWFSHLSLKQKHFLRKCEILFINKNEFEHVPFIRIILLRDAYYECDKIKLKSITEIYKKLIKRKQKQKQT